MQRPGATEGHQREVAGIEAAIDAAQTQLLRPVVMGDLEYAVGDVGQIETHLLGKATNGFAGLRLVEVDSARERVIRTEAPEREVRVGDGRLRGPPAVAGGPRVRARALR